MNDQDDFVQLLTLYKDGDIAIVKSMLEAHDITYYVSNENFSKTYGGIGVGIFVASKQVAEAKDILTSFM